MKRIVHTKTRCIVYYDDNGKEHRENGPAVIWPNGVINWMKRDTFHREELPSIILSDGARIWHTDGYMRRQEYP